MSVAGEPRNRDLAFAALRPVARSFNTYFEVHAQRREGVLQGSQSVQCAVTAPQVVLANTATAQMLWRLGRRLAYLPTVGQKPTDPELVRLGRHLLFLSSYAAVPGQQLLLTLTDLLNAHWVTPQSAPERQSLAALDAYIEPTAGEHGFFTAARAERNPTGPVLSGQDEDGLDTLVNRINQQRNGSTDLGTVRPLLGRFEEFYRPFTESGWQLLWRCLERERAYPEAASVSRRWLANRLAYTRHIDWMANNGLRRTRQTARQAAFTLHQLEEATRLLAAEEACDDPLRMTPDRKSVV